MNSNVISLPNSPDIDQQQPVLAECEQGLKAEIARVDVIIKTYEGQIAYWRWELHKMSTELGYDFVKDAIERDEFKLNHARMLRAGLAKSL